jgi:hypothetical protein
MICLNGHGRVHTSNVLEFRECICLPSLKGVSKSYRICILLYIASDSFSAQPVCTYQIVITTVANKELHRFDCWIPKRIYHQRTYHAIYCNAGDGRPYWT